MSEQRSPEKPGSRSTAPSAVAPTATDPKAVDPKDAAEASQPSKRGVSNIALGVGLGLIVGALLGNPGMGVVFGGLVGWLLGPLVQRWR